MHRNKGLITSSIIQATLLPIGHSSEWLAVLYPVVPSFHMQLSKDAGCNFQTLIMRSNSCNGFGDADVYTLPVLTQGL